MAHLYANENFPRKVAEFLREMGHDVLTTSEAGNAGQAIPDNDLLAFAVRTNRSVLTLNRRDFIRLHRDAPNHLTKLRLKPTSLTWRSHGCSMVMEVPHAHSQGCSDGQGDPRHRMC